MNCSTESFFAYKYLFYQWMKGKKAHFIGWAFFILWEVVIVGLLKGSFGSFLNYLIHYTINISLFYIHAAILLKASRGLKGFEWKGLILAGLVLSLYIVFVYNLDLFLYKHTSVFKTHVPEALKTKLLGLLWRGLYFMFFSTGYYFLLIYLNERDNKVRVEKAKLLTLVEKEKLEKDLAIAKNAFVTAQISPHLLFNSLESIYLRIKPISPADAEIIMCHAEIMRFAVGKTHQSGTIELREEIEHVENLIKINQFEQNGFSLEFAYDPAVLSLKLIPLLLITIVENMFKHGDLANSSVRSLIDIYTTEGMLVLETCNKIKPVENRRSLKTGLKNLKARLNQAYGAGAVLDQLTLEHEFRLSIKIDLKLIDICCSIDREELRLN